jgi:hypothetical protein
VLQVSSCTFGHASIEFQCPLLGVKQTFNGR